MKHVFARFWEWCGLIDCETLAKTPLIFQGGAGDVINLGVRKMNGPEIAEVALWTITSSYGNKVFRYDTSLRTSPTALSPDD